MLPVALNAMRWSFKVDSLKLGKQSYPTFRRESDRCCVWKFKKRPWTITMFVMLTLLIDVSLWQVIKCLFVFQSLCLSQMVECVICQERLFDRQPVCLPVVPTRTHLPSFVLTPRAGHWRDTSAHVGMIRWIKNLNCKVNDHCPCLHTPFATWFTRSCSAVPSQQLLMYVVDSTK